MPATAPLQIEIYRHTFRQRLQRDQESRERQRQQALQAVRDKAPAILAAYPSVRRAYLFGSVTRPGAFRPTSDIDIALEGTTAAEYFAVWRDLERARLDGGCARDHRHLSLRRPDPQNRNVDL
jgi:predicted nucleotidyltransferase